MTTIAEVMTTEVITVTLDTSLRELAKILDEKQINGVPVVDDENSVIGVVCESDLISKDTPLHIPTVFVILDSFIPLENPFRLQKEFKRLTATRVSDVYSSPVTTLEPDADLQQAARLMVEKKFYTIPVVSGGKLVGILGKRDVIRSLYD